MNDYKPGSWVKADGTPHMVCYDEGEYVVILDGYATRPVLRSSVRSCD